jgi:hypothetical protein
VRTDAEIRRALVEQLQLDDPSAAIFHELPLARGVGRADVAAINGVLAGYEIKSERDSLRRIISQRNHYDSVFDYVVIVVARPHLQKVRATIPKQWGIRVADYCDGRTVIRHVRHPKRNRLYDASVRARLLWKRECVTALANNGVRVKSSGPILRMWEQVAALPATCLAREVREALKRRQSVGQRVQCDGSRTIEATA